MWKYFFVESTADISWGLHARGGDSTTRPCNLWSYVVTVLTPACHSNNSLIDLTGSQQGSWFQGVVVESAGLCWRCRISDNQRDGKSNSGDLDVCSVTKLCWAEYSQIVFLIRSAPPLCPWASCCGTTAGSVLLMCQYCLWWLNTKFILWNSNYTVTHG